MEYTKYCHCDKDPDFNSSCTNNNNIYIYPPDIKPKPEKEAVFAQVADRNLNVPLTQTGSIQLVSEPEILLQQGGFSVSSKNGTNNVINFPDAGVYKLDINIKYSFLPPNDATIGTYYQVVVEPKLNDVNILPALEINTGLATTETNSQALAATNILDIKEKGAKLTLSLISFNFDLPFNKTISFYDIIVNIVKISDKPID